MKLLSTISASDRIPDRFCIVSMNFCRGVADVPPRETSLRGDERGKTSAVRKLMRYRQIFNHFNFLCLTIRQGSQYQRNNKVIKITKQKILSRSSNLEILPRVSLIWC